MEDIDGIDDLTGQPFENVVRLIRKAKPDREMPYKKQNKKQDYTGNKYRLRTITKGTVMNDKYREIFNDKTTIYYFLMANIVRGKMRNDKYNIYNDYYKNHKQLACSFPVRHIAKECCMTYYKAQKYLKELRKDGVIRVERVDSDKERQAYIYILGTYTYYDGKIEERLFLDDRLEEDK